MSGTKTLALDIRLKESWGWLHEGEKKKKWDWSHRKSLKGLEYRVTTFEW